MYITWYFLKKRIINSSYWRIVAHGYSFYYIWNLYAFTNTQKRLTFGQGLCSQFCTVDFTKTVDFFFADLKTTYITNNSFFYSNVFEGLTAFPTNKILNPTYNHSHNIKLYIIINIFSYIKYKIIDIYKYIIEITYTPTVW